MTSVLQRGASYGHMLSPVKKCILLTNNPVVGHDCHTCSYNMFLKKNRELRRMLAKERYSLYLIINLDYLSAYTQYYILLKY